MADSYPLRFADQLRQHLRALRKRRGLTQSQLGKLIGVSQARIAEIEANPGAVSVEQMMQLLSTLGSTLVLQEDEQVSYPFALKVTAKRGSNKTRFAVKQFKQPSGAMHFVSSAPKFTFNTPSGQWYSHVLRHAATNGPVTSVVVSPPIKEKRKTDNKSDDSTHKNLQEQQRLNQDEEVAATSHRNFVIRPKKGSW